MNYFTIKNSNTIIAMIALLLIANSYVMCQQQLIEMPKEKNSRKKAKAILILKSLSLAVNSGEAQAVHQKTFTKNTRKSIDKRPKDSDKSVDI